MDLERTSSKFLDNNSSSVCNYKQKEQSSSAKCDNVQVAKTELDKNLYDLPKTSIYLSSQSSGSQVAFTGNFFSKLFVPFFNNTSLSKLYDDLIKNTGKCSNEDLARLYKMFANLDTNDIDKLSQHINYLKNGNKLNLLDIYIGESDFDYKFAIDMCNKLNNNLQAKGVKSISSFEYEKMLSKGKDVTKMSDAELKDYYTSMIPYINKAELDCLVNQIHRIKNGGPRYLNTPEESEILKTIKVKQQCGLLLRGINLSKGTLNPSELPKGNIPFVKKELTDFQRNQLAGWTWSGASPARIEGIFDDLAITLNQDTFLYRGINLAPQNKKSVDYFNNIKVGSIIDNSKRYISTAQNVETALTYSVNQTYGFNQFYILKIKVPAGTKAIDNRIYEGINFDEMILPPNKLKVTGIDYNTGVVECEYLPI